MPEIVVPIPALLRSDDEMVYLNETIDSLRAQTFGDWEAIVVCDGGLEPEPMDDPRFHVVTQARQGPGAARNRAVSLSVAPWIVPLDADDCLVPDALERLYAARRERMVIYGDLEWIGDRHGVERLPDYRPDLLISLQGPLPVTALHHRTAWERVNGWDEHLLGLEDVEYWMRLAEHGICPQHVPGVTLQYRARSDSRHHLIADRRDLAEQIRERHRRFFAGLTTPCQEDRVEENARENWVELKYQGPSQSTFRVVSPHSGETYVIEGRGHQFFVHPLDATWLEAPTRFGQEYTRIIRQTGFIGKPIDQPSIDFSTLAVEADAVPDVTRMNVREAKRVIAETDNLPDLRVMQALEAGTDQRESVLKALDARQRELGGGGV